MITVTEVVFDESGKVEHTTQKEWRLKFRFLSELKKLKGVSAKTISELSKSNSAEFEIDGVKRRIDIQPHIELGIVKDE